MGHDFDCLAFLHETLLLSTVAADINNGCLSLKDSRGVALQMNVFGCVKIGDIGAAAARSQIFDSIQVFHYYPGDDHGMDSSMLAKSDTWDFPMKLVLDLL